MESSSEIRDIYDKYHKTKGDTSEGRWLTVALTVIGVALAVAEFFLYVKYRQSAAVMITVCLFNFIYTYIEISFLCIRKYYFRYTHRRLAVLLILFLYLLVMLLLVLAASRLLSLFPFEIYCLYIPFICLPPCLVIAALLVVLLIAISGG